MNSMIQGIKQFLKDEDGASGVEYALLLAFCALVMVTLGSTVQGSIKTIWTNLNTALGTVVKTAGG